MSRDELYDVVGRVLFLASLTLVAWLLYTTAPSKKLTQASLGAPDREECWVYKQVGVSARLKGCR